MDNMPISAVIFQSVPENFILLTMGLALIGIRPKFSRIPLIAAVNALSSYFIRRLPFTWGVHTILLMLVSVLMLKRVHGIKISKAFMVHLIGLISLVLVEMLWVPFFLAVSGYQLKEILQDPLLRVIVPWPEYLILGAAAWLVIRRRFGFTGREDLFEPGYEVGEKE